MEVLYHIRPDFLGIFPYIGLKNRPYINGIGTSNESDPGMAIDIYIYISMAFLKWRIPKSPRVSRLSHGHP